MSDKKWYVIKTVAGQELKVKDYIEREIQYQNLNDYIGQIVVPMEKVIQTRNGKKYQKEKVHFPGYVMIEAALQGEVPHVIKNISGVISFLSATKGGDPVPMRQSEVNRMLGIADELAVNVDNSYMTQYIIGETVKVIDGAFNGFNGTVEKIIEDKRKLEVMVLIFGRKTPLELNFNQVEKIV
ncbi:transcription termination/antitermination protein NusG [Faecalibacter macacae]|uniref:Transcription termination/antitermination protein NusG n=1 Tax=Faecalibacter macacae TaxID=1859289 RepID=A0A3L9MHW3_9FLAO|nr:transcription termination/antitermination protein NusG [Faecalibacter macacae]RLZ12670.1 transcription termination/antitermination factor NusG [Faecalibacter macacae]